MRAIAKIQTREAKQVVVRRTDFRDAVEVGLDREAEAVAKESQGEQGVQAYEGKAAFAMHNVQQLKMWLGVALRNYLASRADVRVAREK